MTSGMLDHHKLSAISSAMSHWKEALCCSYAQHCRACYMACWDSNLL